MLHFPPWAVQAGNLGKQQSCGSELRKTVLKAMLINATLSSTLSLFWARTVRFPNVLAITRATCQTCLGLTKAFARVTVLTHHRDKIILAPFQLCRCWAQLGTSTVSPQPSWGHRPFSSISRCIVPGYP